MNLTIDGLTIRYATSDVPEITFAERPDGNGGFEVIPNTQVWLPLRLNFPIEWDGEKDIIIWEGLSSSYKCYTLEGAISDEGRIKFRWAAISTTETQPGCADSLRAAAGRLYDAAHWSADRPCDEQQLWEDLRDALGRIPGASPTPLTGVLPSTAPVEPLFKQTPVDTVLFNTDDLRKGGQC